MPRYRFNIDNGIGFVADEEGRELPDLAVARAEGMKGIRSILAEDVLNGRLDLKGRLDVVGQDGNILLTISFAEAVEVSR